MASLLLINVYLLHLVEANQELNKHIESNGNSFVQMINCGEPCKVRCSKSWKLKMCKRACDTCCVRCNCVPPSTLVYTRGMCPCYAKMITHGGCLKCP
ncbi:Gibberellin regulated protein [Dioscorea alata]|uniref:Gibberellin regulated protein n=1 Tax=Dioscorea alata TaxID=55571 RepID=A0ACB7WF29_DIOAL|nr:Gibberellin regulated protein [Dioscorea alata]